MTMVSRFAAFVALGATAFVAACGDNIKPEQPAVVDTARSTITVSPTTGVRADGLEYVIATVTVKDGNNVPLPGMRVSIAASGEGNAVEQPPLYTGVDGIAMGTVTSTIAGTKEISATASNGVEVFELGQRAAALFTPVADLLVFVAQPADGVAGETLDPMPQVEIRDNVGTLMTDVTGPVTIALQDNPGASELRGTLTVEAVGGIATFDDLRLTRAGAGYTLVVRAPGLGAAVSDAFAISAAAPAALVFTQEPTNALAGEAIDPAVALEVRDAFGNVTTDAAGVVTIALEANPTAATLSGTTVRNLLDGAVSFHDLSVDQVAAGYTLTATFGELPSVTSARFSVGAGAVASLEVGGLANPVVAGEAVAIIVVARDAFGNVVRGFDHTVVTTSTDSSAVLPGSYAFVAGDAGTHIFQGAALRTAGVQTVTVTSQSDSSIHGSTSTLVVPAAASALVFTAPPTNGRSGISLAPAVAVTLRDPFGNTAAESHQQVTLSIASGPSGAALVGGGPRPPVTGVVAFDHVQLDKVGSYTLRASAAGVAPATSATFTIAAGNPASLAFLVEPSPVVAGANVSPAVQVGIFDAAGNPAITATDAVTLLVHAGPIGATLVGLGPVAAVAGVATFAGIHGATAGTYELEATSGTLAPAVSVPFDIGAANGAKLALLSQPANAVAGVAQSPAITVAVQDQYGNLLPTATDAVSLAIVSGPAGGVILGGGPVDAVGGVATFADVKFQRAGAYTIRATAAGGLVSAASSQFAIGPAALSGLGFVTQPSDTTPAIAIAPAVQVALQDAFGNTVNATAPSIGLQLTGGDPSAVLAGGAAVAPVAGVATFANLTVSLAASGYTLVAASPGLTTGYSAPFAVFGPPDHVAFTTQPPSSPVSGTFTLAVAVKDASGVTIANDDTTQITIAFDNNAGGGALSGTTTRTAVNGVATFTGLAIDAVGTGYTLRATSGVLTAATSAAFNIYGAAAALDFTVDPPAHVAANATFSVQVTVLDAGGRRVENATNDITVALDTFPSGATLLGTTTRAAVAGQVTFGGLRLQKAGAYTLVATANGLTPAGAVGLTVDPLAAATFAVTGLPGSMTAGSGPASVTVTALDQFGNVATGYAGTVHFTATDTLAGLPANYPFVPGTDHGVHQFTNGVMFYTAGAQTVTATDTVATSITGSQGTTVSAGAATGYTVTQLVSAVAGVAKDVTVAVTDAWNNPVTGYVGTIHFATSDPIGTVPVNYTFISGDAGTKTFGGGVTLRRAGSQTFTVSEVGGSGLTSPQSVLVSAATAAKVGFTAQPTSTLAGDVIAPPIEVAIQDQFDNTVLTDNASQIIVALHTGAPPAAVLSGTKTVTASGGVATFDDLSLNVSAAGYRLDATSGTLTGATSNTFDIATTPATYELQITEIMHSTGGNRLRQWIEVKNVSTKILSVNGLEVTETVSAATFTVASEALLYPGEYYVLGASNNSTLNGGVTTVDYVYPTPFTMAAPGGLVLTYDIYTLDTVAWDASTWPHAVGAAMNLSINVQTESAKAQPNNYPWWWCDATTALTTGFGTPGADNILCGTAAAEPLYLCRLQNPLDIPAPVTFGTPTPIAGRFREPGVTTRDTCNDFYPHVEGEVGFGPYGSDPTTASWTWASTGFDPAYLAGACVANEDQLIGNATFTEGGIAAFGYRVRLIDPATLVAGPWSYCDRAGIAVTPSAGDYGTATVMGPLVISQFYASGGNSGATYKYDFVELHNRSASPVTFANWSIQYTSATGTGLFGSGPALIKVISATIPAGGYYLVRGALGTNGAELPGFDVDSTLGLGASGGKIALVKQAAPLGCNGGTTVCSTAQEALIADLVGYGGADFYEGAATAPAGSATNSAFRGGAGCTDTNQNGTDFAAAAVAPRYSATATYTCP